MGGQRERRAGGEEAGRILELGQGHRDGNKGTTGEIFGGRFMVLDNEWGNVKERKMKEEVQGVLSLSLLPGLLGGSDCAQVGLTQQLALSGPGEQVLPLPPSVPIASWSWATHPTFHHLGTQDPSGLLAVEMLQGNG